VIAKGKPISAAIRAYEADIGRPPRRLGALVPKYIAEIPRTGLGDFPQYDYLLHDDARRWSPSVRMGHLGFKHMSFAPEPAYPIPVTPMRDGWVMVDPQREPGRPTLKGALVKWATSRRTGSRS
jgi:hypothetical protein